MQCLIPAVFLLHTAILRQSGPILSECTAECMQPCTIQWYEHGISLLQWINASNQLHIPCNSNAWEPRACLCLYTQCFSRAPRIVVVHSLCRRDERGPPDDGHGHRPSWPLSILYLTMSAAESDITLWAFMLSWPSHDSRVELCQVEQLPLEKKPIMKVRSELRARRLVCRRFNHKVVLLLWFPRRLWWLFHDVTPDVSCQTNDPNLHNRTTGTVVVSIISNTPVPGMYTPLVTGCAGNENILGVSYRLKQRKSFLVLLDCFHHRPSCMTIRPRNQTISKTNNRHLPPKVVQYSGVLYSNFVLSNYEHIVSYAIKLGIHSPQYW